MPPPYFVFANAGILTLVSRGIEVRYTASCAAGTCATFVAIGQGGFVAMMSVGDHQFFVRHSALDRLDYAWIGDRPQAVHHVVFVTDLHVGLSVCRRVEQCVHTSDRVAVKHEQLPGMRFCVAQ